MGAVHTEITEELRGFIGRQGMFFVASAPLSGEGHVNVSPKGLDTFRVLGSKRVAYLDLTGSGNETAAHIKENGRVTVMFCAFEGQPKILRLYGRGRVVLPGSGEWGELAALFSEFAGARQVVVVELERVQTSCGFGVPLMKPEGVRPMLPEWAGKKTAEELAAYRAKKNGRSIDGLPTYFDAS